MFTDSHTHILSTTRKIENPENMMSSLKEEAFRFVMDIGTEPGDLMERMKCVKDISDGSIPSFIHFSAGLWPHSETIKNRDASLAMLENDIKIGIKEAQDANLSSKPIFALGECGLDRYWNGKDAPMINEGGTFDVEGEKELFIRQLEMAKKYNLAVIIHSRDAYKETLECIDKVGWNKGVIHCYSYGEEEAKTFLERGWFISFPGNITFAKTNITIEKIKSLMLSIPKERLLLETDAPYMTPVPLRGKPNTSLYIKHTYQKASEYLSVPVEKLCDIVFENCCNLFTLS
ncbi:MAG: TatD family hydrolase [Treponema sp.]